MNKNRLLPQLPQLIITDSQAIKAMAIIMVVLSHFRKLYVLPENVQNILNPCGYLGVALFLMLSGYGCAVSKSNNNLSTFCKRVVRVLVPLVIITLITVVLMKVLGINIPRPLNIVWQCLGVRHSVCSAAWYISLQLFCWLSFLSLGKIKLWVWSSCLSVLILICSIFIEVKGLYLDLWGLNAFSFVAGVLLSRYNVDKRTFWISLLLFVFLFFTCYFVMGNPKELILRNTMKSLVSLSFIIMIFSFVIVMGNVLWPKWILVIGKNAYYIYLVHAFFAFVFGTYVIGMNLLATISILILVIIIGSYVLKKLDILAKIWLK